MKLAIEHGYTITPYATVGAEEAFDVLRYRGRAEDSETLDRVRSRVGEALTRLIAELRGYRAQDTGQGPLRRVLNRL